MMKIKPWAWAVIGIFIAVVVCITILSATLPEIKKQARKDVFIWELNNIGATFSHCADDCNVDSAGCVDKNCLESCNFSVTQWKSQASYFNYLTDAEIEELVTSYDKEYKDYNEFMSDSLSDNCLTKDELEASTSREIWHGHVGL